MFGFKDLKTAMKDSNFKAYIEAKNQSRKALHTRLDASKETTKPVDKLTDNNGYFTLLSFAQTGG